VRVVSTPVRPTRRLEPASEDYQWDVHGDFWARGGWRFERRGRSDAVSERVFGIVLRARGREEGGARRRAAVYDGVVRSDRRGLSADTGESRSARRRARRRGPCWTFERAFELGACTASDPRYAFAAEQCNFVGRRRCKLVTLPRPCSVTGLLCGNKLCDPQGEAAGSDTTVDTKPARLGPVFQSSLQLIYIRPSSASAFLPSLYFSPAYFIASLPSAPLTLLM